MVVVLFLHVQRSAWRIDRYNVMLKALVNDR
jgi:hypothetical protein